jgi:hypothetical protein
MSGFRNMTALAALVVGLGGCSGDPGFTGVPGVREAEAGEVASCRYVSNIAMTPGVFGPLADQGLKYARNKIKEDALNLGANTVVFEKVSPGADVYRVTATAYSC